MRNIYDDIKENAFRNIIDNYSHSTIQSEAEVRTKLVVPLIEWLGYTSELRAEEFPVYGWQGRTRNPTKNADFLMFSDKNFALNRDCTEKSINWVHNNSLLIIEAKKPGEFPEISGQAMYYTQWTKAIAYIVTDGIQIKGCYYSYTSSDYEYIECSIIDLQPKEFYSHFSYDKVLEIKAKSRKMRDGIYSESAIQDYELGIATAENLTLFDENSITLPIAKRELMRSALSADNTLTDYELLRRFLQFSDTILDCDLRYNIPQFAFYLPRKTVNAQLYINEDIMPSVLGEATLYYWESTERIEFDSGYLNLIFVFVDGFPIQIEASYSVQDSQVHQRLKHLQNVLRVYEADKMLIRLDDSRVCNIDLRRFRHWKKGENFAQNKWITAFWIREMNKLKVIQETYDINFKLKPLHGWDEIEDLYFSVDCVYDGIIEAKNCYLETSYPDTKVRKIKIEKPILMEERDLPLPDRAIHNYIFRPCASMLLPCTMDKRKAKNGIIKIEACCKYRVLCELQDEAIEE